MYPQEKQDNGAEKVAAEGAAPTTDHSPVLLALIAAAVKLVVELAQTESGFDVVICDAVVGSDTLTLISSKVPLVQTPFEIVHLKT